MTTLDYQPRLPGAGRRPRRSAARLARDAMVGLCCVCAPPVVLGLAVLGADWRGLYWAVAPAALLCVPLEPADWFPVAWVLAAVAVLVWVDRRWFSVGVALASTFNASLIVWITKHGLG